MKIIVATILAALCPGAGECQLERSAAAQEVMRLRSEILASTDQGNARLTTPGYLEGHIKDLTSAIRREVLERLNKGNEDPEKLRVDLAPLLNDEVAELKGTLLRSSIDGMRVFVIAYSIAHGGMGLPESTAVIEGFRRIAGRYEYAASAGAEMANTSLDLGSLPSPRTNELWLLAHGKQMRVMQYHQRFAIYSFDGFEFHLLWKHEPLLQSSFQFSNKTLQITYDDAESIAPMILTVELTPGGPVETSRSPKQ